MKYCQECGTKLNDSAKFCVKCGTPCLNVEDISFASNVVVSDCSKYYGMKFKDIFGKTIELTSQGVRIYRTTGIYLKFDNFIPYKHILHLSLIKPSFLNGSGSLTVVTASEGALKASSANNPFMKKAVKDANEKCDKTNMVSFHSYSDIEGIYNALNMILCN